MSDRAGLLDVYDASVGDVYGYLLRRCRHQADAEDLTSEVFLAAAAAVRDRDARDVLGGLGEPHRSALTLRYVDGLTVPTMAGVLDRTIHATEAVLVRARRAFRIAYE